MVIDTHVWVQDVVRDWYHCRKCGREISAVFAFTSLVGLPEYWTTIVRF